MNRRKEGMADLMKQGLMKPRKQKMTTIYRVWMNDDVIGAYAACVTENKGTADCYRMRAGFVRIDISRERR